MNQIIPLLKKPFLWTLLLAVLAFSLSIAAWLKGGHINTQKIVVADIEAITDAQKLVWVQGMKNGHTEKVIGESRLFEQKLKKVLEELGGEGTVILDRKAIIAGMNVEDITPIVMQKLNLNASEVSLLRRELERDFFTDFPTMRKARP